MLTPFTLNTARVSGYSLKHVRCEQCGARFFYRVDRRAEGDHVSVFITKAAMEVAERKLEAVLERASELVACPACRWVQRAMIRDKRVKLIKTSLLPLCASPIFAVMLTLYLLDRSVSATVFRATFWNWSAGIGASIVVISTALTIFFQPNRGRFFPFGKHQLDEGTLSMKSEEDWAGPKPSED